MKHILCTVQTLLLCLVLCMCFNSEAFADTVDSGSCGDNVTWTLYSSGELEIDGTGAMKDYRSESSVPWYNYRNYITEIMIKPGILKIGNMAFCECAQFKEINIPQGVTSIGAYAFAGCENLMHVTIPDGVANIGDYCFLKCTNLASVIIPDSLTAIGFGMFEYCSKLDSVILPSSITSIDEWAFNGCSGLTNVTIPSDLTSIGNAAFSGCSSLTDITIPSKVTSIGVHTFSCCSGLTSVTIHEGVSSIGFGAFAGCSGLTSVMIPSSVTTLGGDAFLGCSALTAIWVDEQNLLYRDINGALLNKDGTILIRCPEGWQGQFTVPENVTWINVNAFEGCNNLTVVSIPESVTTIEMNGESFGACKTLTKIKVDEKNLNYCDIDGILCDKEKTTILRCPQAWEGTFEIPEGFTHINGGAFIDCRSLTAVTIPSSMKSIDGYSFYQCYGLASISIPSSVTSIGVSAFFLCNGLTDVYYGGTPEQWKDIFINTDNAPLLSSTIHYTLIASGLCADNLRWELDVDGVLTIWGEGQMNGSTYSWQDYRDQINSVVIESGVTSIGKYAFINHFELTSVIIPESVRIIGNSAFGGCWRLKDLTIQEGVTSIMNEAFYACTSLEELSIPMSVKSIGDSAFYSCSNLKKVSIPYNTTTFGGNIFQECAGLESAGPMGTDCNIVFGWTSEIPAKVFYGCSSLKYVIFPETIKSIGDNAFVDCDKLTDIVFPSALSTIGNWAFARCSGFTSMIIPPNITHIGDGAFYGCTGLTRLTLSEGLKSIGFSAFSSCTNLSSVIIPDGLANIGRHAFAGCPELVTAGSIGSNCNFELGLTEAIPDCLFFGCTSLSSAIIPDGIKTINNLAFSECEGLINIIIPSSVTNIDYCAFYGCTSLSNVVIPEGVTSIGGYAFDGCTNLTSISIPSSVTEIWPAAFADSGITTIHVDSQNACYCDVDGVLFNKDKTMLHTFPSGKSGFYAVPNGIIQIGESAFSGSRMLNDLQIPQGVNDIGDEAFRDCVALRSIMIPESVTYIGSFVSEGWKNSIEIYYAGTEEQWKQIEIIYGGNYSYGYFDTSCNIELKNANKHYNVVPDFALPFAVVEIENEAFTGGVFTYVKLSDNTTSIGWHAFADCPNLVYIYIPAPSINIDEQAFGNKQSLTIFGIPNSSAETYAVNHGFTFIPVA